MELLFGNRVRSENRRLGSLAGVEIDGSSRRVTKIIFSDDGKLGSHAYARPVRAVRVAGGVLQVAEATGAQTSGQPLLLSRSTRLMRKGREAGRLTGALISDNGALQTLYGKQHWWTKRQSFSATGADFSLPGEIRFRDSQTAAA